MGTSDWSRWTVQERCVGELIIWMFEEKDPSGTIGFTPANIYDGYYDRLKKIWVPKYSSSTDRQKEVIRIFERLRHLGELICSDEHKDTFYLSKHGYLYQELEMRNAT